RRRDRAVPQHAADPRGARAARPHPERARGIRRLHRPQLGNHATPRGRTARGSPVKSGLTSSTALVTGAGRGLGRAIAVHLAELGAAVVAADIDGETAKRTAAAVEEAGPPAMAVEMDVSDPESVAAGVDDAEREMGGFSILMNNAGIDRTAPIGELSEAEWRSVLGVNLDGPFFLSRHTFT